MLLRLRAPLSLVAVLLFVALVAAVFAGTRLLEDWNAFHNPAPGGGTSSVLQELESRPLAIAIPKSPADCVTGPYYNGIGGGFATGPISAMGGPPTSTAWGDYYHTVAFADARVPGPVLVRAVHLFNSEGVVFVGPNAAGPVVGSDTVDGKLVQQHTEAVIDTSRTQRDPGAPWTIGSLAVNHPFIWPMISGESHTAAGGTGWQIDGPTFSETFLVC